MRKLLLVIPGLLLLSACSASRCIPVHNTTADTLRITVLRADTLRIADSTVIDRTADTVRIERWRSVDRHTLVRDTLWRSRTDTVSVPVPVPGRVSTADRLSSLIAGAATGAITTALIMTAVVMRRRRD
ncbi:MAG: hypothetical protein K2L49_08675 [Muribaculaceae bacterium]|nr:hypothetical protein [Muribaculaceae bacterium]